MITIALDKVRHRIRAWVLKHARGKSASRWLALMAFTESSISPIPPDIMLGAILSAGAGRAMYYSAITVIFSVAGGALGYVIGIWLFDTVGQSLVQFYGLENELLRVGQAFSDSAFITVFLAAFTPIPYKIFTIASGLFKINFMTFILASILGRGLRYFIFGFIANKYGPKLGLFLFRYFNYFAFIVAVVLIIVLFIAII
jgi:membrane protein YqaA with SNARE-associated domain